MKSVLQKLTGILLIFTFLITQTACTKEKAEALKSSAEQFRVEANSALNVTATLRRQSVAVLAQSREEELIQIVRELTAKPMTDSDLTDFTAEVFKTGTENADAVRTIDTAFKSMAEEYELFASIFDSLPRGHWFAKDAVPKAERHAIRLTIRFIKMADDLQKAPVPFTAKRAEIVDKMLTAQTIADTSDKKQAYLLLAQQLLQLREDERKANQDAVLQCLKAAETGKAVAELIRNYSKFKVEDMLNTVKDALNTANAITGGTNTDVKAWVSRYTAFVNNKVKTDDIWKDVLTNDVKWAL